MADQETTVPMDDKDTWAAAMADEPKPEAQPPPAEAPKPSEQPEAVPDATGRLHSTKEGEKGRFVPKQETDADAAPLQQPPVEAKPQPSGQPEPEPAESPGIKQLREAHERAERRAEEARFEAYSARQREAALQRQIAELSKPKQEPADFFADPNAAIKQTLDPFQTQFQDLASRLTLRASRAENLAAHGKEAVAEMEKAVDAAMRVNHPDMPLLSQRMRQSDDPVGEAMKWFQQDKLLKETGGDLTAFKTKALEEALNNPEFLAKAIQKAQAQAGQQSPGSRPNVQLPPSLNKATGAGVPTSDLTEADGTDAAVFRYAVSSPRR